MSFDVTEAMRLDMELVRAIDDMSPAMQRCEGVIREAIDKRFEEQSDGTSAWAPLKEATIKQRVAQGYGAGPILQRTQSLRNSMRGEHDRDSAQVGPSDDIAYARTHAEGDPSRNIPARNYLALTEAEVDKTEAEIVAHLERAGG